MPLYDRTRHFQVYESGTIPGLFQTPEYARALMGSVIAFHGMPNDLDAAVAARMARQRVIREGDHRIAVLLEESALRARIGGEAVMVEYRPTGFYYAGVDGEPNTYTTQLVTGTVSRGADGACQISRNP